MPKDIRSALTENLNELMKIKGIKAVDLAEKVGVSKSAVSHWLAGDNSPNIEILAKICQSYDVKLSDMLNEKIEATYADKELLKKYHNLDNYGKEAVNNILDIEHKRCVEQQSNKHGEKLILSTVAARSADNSTKVHTQYIKDLSKYTPDDTDL